jgi:hypothetical protein
VWTLDSYVTEAKRRQNYESTQKLENAVQTSAERVKSFAQSAIASYNSYKSTMLEIDRIV